MKFIVLALAINVVLLSSSLNCAEKLFENTSQAIKVGLVVFPPLVLKENNDSCYGDAVEYVKKVLKSTRLPLQVYCASAARIYQDFNQNKLDITINVKTTKTLSEAVYFARSPFTKLEIMLYSIEDSTNKSVSAIKKFDYQGERSRLEKEGYRFVDRADVRQAFMLFLRKHTHHLISYKQPIDYYLSDTHENNTFKKLDIGFTEKLLFEVPTYLVVNTNSKHSTTLINSIEEYNERETP